MAEHRWGDARRAFSSAREVGVLEAGDMAGLGEAAWWQGDIDESLKAFEEAYRLYLAQEELDPRAAGRLAMEIGYFWFLRGEEAIGSGWFGRAHRLLEPEPDAVEHGYLQSITLDMAIEEGDFDAAIATAREILELSRRHSDETLEAMALVGEGIATVKRGDVVAGMSILDEAMLPVVAGRVEAAYAGNIYCQLMQVCHELADVQRADQWTDSTERWCEGFEDAVMFLGICRVHRAQLMQRRGEWDRAEAEARQVCRDLADMNIGAVAEGFYQLAELHRLRGDLQEAAAAYREADERGRDPQPGLALLRLAEGDPEAAGRDVRSALEIAADDLARAPLWAAQVEIAAASKDLELAREASIRLTGAAELFGSSGFLAEGCEARGRVALAVGDVAVATSELQSACRQWQALQAPYRAARARVLLAVAHQKAENSPAAERELDAAARVFASLGAELDAQGIMDLRDGGLRPGGLTRREVEVLAAIAGGKTNKAAAQELFLSEKTVSRHLANIYNKLGVSSRTAAAAYAFQHGIAASPSD